MKKIVLLIIAALALPLIYQVNIVEIIKLRTFDALIKPVEETGNIVLLNITDKDLQKYGQWPWSREQLGLIHVDLLNAGATSVSWVVSFPEPDRFGKDEVFAEALSYYPSVLAMFETDTWNDIPTTEGTVILGDEVGGIQAQGVLQNIPVLRDQALQGIVSAPVDVDNLLRRMPLLMRSPDGWLAAFATQMLKAVTGTNTYVIKTNEYGIEEIRVKQLHPIPTDQYGRVWINWTVPRGTTLEAMDVEGKMVVVNLKAKGILPMTATPVGLLTPAEIQAAVAETIIHASSQPMPGIPANSILYELFIFASGTLAVFIMVNYLGLYLGLGLSLASMVAVGGGGVFLIKSGAVIDVTWTLISQYVTASPSFYIRFREQYKLRQQIRDQFGTYISPEYVDIIIKNPDLMVLGGQNKTMSYLFSDIVGFTPISEMYMKNDDPEGLVSLINHFLDEMTKVVIGNGMTLDKYMGDCIMAWAGAPIPREDHAIITVKTAIELELLCQKLNQDLKDQGLDLPPVMFGSGISTGPSIVGNTGSSMRMNYSVIGDAVNLGARLEGETRKQDTPILLPQATYDLIQNEIACVYVDKIKVKGKEDEITIYAPLIKGKVLKLKK